MAKKKKKPANRTPEVMEEHQYIISQYYSNGFNGIQAVLTSRPHITYNTAASVWDAIKNSPHNKAFMQEHKERLMAMVDIQPENITKELIQWSYADITQFAGLTVEELKELPPDLRRCIQSIDVTNHTDKHGNDIGQTVKLKLVPKLDSMKELAKHIGYYSVDNEQKSNKINILQVLKDSSPETLNTLLATIEQSGKE